MSGRLKNSFLKLIAVIQVNCTVEMVFALEASSPKVDRSHRICPEIISTFNWIFSTH
jgi:hypothetical protein